MILGSQGLGDVALALEISPDDDLGNVKLLEAQTPVAAGKTLCCEVTAVRCLEEEDSVTPASSSTGSLSTRHGDLSHETRSASAASLPTPSLSSRATTPSTPQFWQIPPCNDWFDWFLWYVLRPVLFLVLLSLELLRETCSRLRRGRRAAQPHSAPSQPLL